MKKITLFLLPAALLLSGCGPQLTDRNLKIVKPEMSSKEVESILGQPTRVEQGSALQTKEVQTLPVTRYIYEQEGRKVELTFVEDRLADGDGGINGSFDPPDPKAKPAAAKTNP